MPYFPSPYYPLICYNLFEKDWKSVSMVSPGSCHLQGLKGFAMTALLVSQKSPGPFKPKMRPYSARRLPWPQVWTCGFLGCHHDWHRWRPGHNNKFCTLNLLPDVSVNIFQIQNTVAVSILGRFWKVYLFICFILSKISSLARGWCPQS